MKPYPFPQTSWDSIKSILSIEGIKQVIMFGQGEFLVVVDDLQVSHLLKGDIETAEFEILAKESDQWNF